MKTTTVMRGRNNRMSSNNVDDHGNCSNDNGGGDDNASVVVGESTTTMTQTSNTSIDSNSPSSPTTMPTGQNKTMTYSTSAIKVKMYMSKSPDMRAIPIQTTLDNCVSLMKKFRTLEQIVVRNCALYDTSLLLPLLDSVQCSQIVQLHLVSAELTQFPSRVICRLTELTYLNLSSNLIEELPHDLEQIIVSRKLNTLDLSCNRLRTLPASLAALFDRGLQNLDVQENFLALDQLPSCLKLHTHHGIRKKWHNQHVAQQVIDRVYLGSVHAARNRQFLFEKRVTHILSVNHMRPPFPSEFQYKLVREYDQPTSNLLQHLEECFEFIDEALENPQGSVLVHCAAGQSRSATVVIAYVMYKMRLSFEEAFHLVCDKRCCIAPNHGFLSQLKLFSGIGMQYSGEAYLNHIEQMIRDCVPSAHLNLQYCRLQDIPLSVVLRRDELQQQQQQSQSHQYQQWRVINLSYNSLTNLERLSDCCTELVELNVSHNLLGQLSDHFISSCLARVHTLDISFNQIQELPVALFHHTPLLKHFNASHNQIQILPSEVEEWRDHIESIDLSFNQLTSLPNSLLALGSSLRTLILKNNCFTQDPPVLHELRRTSSSSPPLSIRYMTTTQSPASHK